MKFNKYCLLVIHTLFIFLSSIYAQSSETQDKMAWWRDARYGMFIHWGVYSVPGNVYEGLNVAGEHISYNKVGTGIPSEWIMNIAQIPRSMYRQFGTQFDAKDYDPKKWVQLCKDAGMKYIIITAKHHDGFCLFETKYTDWNAVDASAAQRDLLKDLVAEAKNAGIKIGFYYSQNQDWMHEGGMGNIPELGGKVYPQKKVKQYVDSLVIPQIKELTDNYDIDVFWYDSPDVNTTPELAASIQKALLNSKLGDKIIFNDRLGGGMEGLYRSIETDTPDLGYNGEGAGDNWESCASLNDSWGYEYTPNDHWKSALYTISRILEISSKGGNFLLNVGPDMHGNIPEKAENILKEVGDWMKIYGDAVYGTSKNKVRTPFPYGYVTQKNNSDGSVHLYLCIPSHYWSNSDVINFYGVMELPEKATILGSRQQIPVDLGPAGLKLHLASDLPNKYYSVIDLHFKRMPPQIPVLCMDENDQIMLTPYQSIIHGNLKKDYIPYAIKDWYYNTDVASWIIRLMPGTYQIALELSAVNQGIIMMNLDGQQLNVDYPKTANMDTYITQKSRGILSIFKEDDYILNISRETTPGVYNIVNLRNVILTKKSDTTIDQLHNEVLKVFPTPAKDFVTIETNVPQKISIFNMQGILMKSFNSNYSDQINISNFAPGIYFVKGKTSLQKFSVY